MRIIRSILAAVITLSLVAGYGSVPMEKTASAVAKNKNITIKAAPDFTLTIPAVWKNNYVMKSRGGKKHGSYVFFSAKKIYKETGDGFLFSIWRYKDDSYTDMPMYEVVGRWNGMNYVAMFPTEIQTIGASKSAIKQYRKLTPAVYDTPYTIMPVKRTGKNVYHAKDFSLKLPSSWKGNYKVVKGKKNSFVAFYARKCYDETGEGFLFSISKYKDDSYKELPSYELVGIWNGVSYVAEFPTDVQIMGASDKAAKQYQKLNKSVMNVVRTIAR